MSLKSPAKVRNNRNGARRFSVSLAILFSGVFFVVLLGLFLLFGKIPTMPGSDAPKRVLYEVPEHISAKALTHDLYERHLIAFPEVLNLIFRLTGWEKRIRAGFYYLPPRNSVMHVAELLTSGQMATRTLTIPEGKTSWEIYGIMRRTFPGDSLDSLTFDELVHSPEFAQSLGVPADNLEGYLFPDTYVLPFSMNERDILKLMVARFHEITADMPRDNYIVKQYGIHGWVTLASIVEKEAAVNREQRRIAGVFQNRLRQGWSLGADPTVRFALHKLTGPLRAEDLRSASAYNTRRVRGLPPGPVCNPGESALRATLNPEKTNMMFFVAKDDGSREHFFSATYAEHNLLKEQAAENRKRLKEMLAMRGDTLLDDEVIPADKTAPEVQEQAPAREVKIAETDARPVHPAQDSLKARELVKKAPAATIPKTSPKADPKAAPKKP